VREGLSRDMAQSLSEDVDTAVHYFETAGPAAAQAPRRHRKTKGVC
jgi:hypothetical protein